VRILTSAEAAEMRALLMPGAGTFDDAILTDLETARRIERYDVSPDGLYRLRPTELGLLALRLHLQFC
jgi:hypothetical protein